MTPSTTDAATPEPGAPYCGSCGYELTGAVDTPRCPECGRPLVEVLQRHGQAVTAGVRHDSELRLWGLPLVSMAWGPMGDERHGRARGFVAIGDVATGVIALGGRAHGVVAAGGFSVGLFSAGGMSIGALVSAGGCSVGGFTVGGFAAGLVASGGGAVGAIASGGGAVGWYARGGGAVGMHVVDRRGSDPQAKAVFDELSWLLGGGFGNALPMVWGVGSIGAVMLLLGVYAWVRSGGRLFAEIAAGSSRTRRHAAARRAHERGQHQRDDDLPRFGGS